MKARILSAVLAILMILAVCPVISLSAAESTVSVWDGKVAGTDMTLEEMKNTFHTNGKQVVVAGIDRTTIKDDLDFNPTGTDNTTQGSEYYIKSAAGLALFSAWSNGYVNFDGWFKNDDVTPQVFAGGTWGKMIRLQTNIDLDNKPWIPIGAYTGAAATAFNFSGQTFYIRNMNIKETADIDLNYRCFGLFGMVNISASRTSTTNINNIALLDATIDITQPAEGSIRNVFVGGVVAFVTASDKALAMYSSVVDANITLTTNGTLDAAEAIQVAGDSTVYQAAAGGIIGYAQGVNNLLITNFLVNGRIEIKKTNATDTPVAAGGVIAAIKAVPATTQTSNGLLNMGIAGATMPDGTVPYYGMANCNGGSCAVWGMTKSMGQKIGGKDVAYGPASGAGAILADTNPLSKSGGKGWKQTAGAGHFPIPAQFESIYDAVDASLYDALFQNLGASVRTKVGETGLRFSVEMTQTVEALGATEYGLLIIPKNKLSGELTADTANALKVIVPAGNILDNTNEKATHQDRWGCGDTSKQFNVALIGIPDANVNTDFVARPYAVLGDGRTVYGNTIERNLVNIVETIMTSGSAADQAAVYDAYKNNATNFGEKFNAYVPQA